VFGVLWVEVVEVVEEVVVEVVVVEVGVTLKEFGQQRR